MAKFNYKLAKVGEDGNLVYAPVPILIDGVPFWVNEKAAEYKEYERQGWYPIERTEMPLKEGFYYTSYWVYDRKNKVCREEWKEHAETVVEPVEEIVIEEPEADAGEETEPNTAEGDEVEE